MAYSKFSMNDFRGGYNSKSSPEAIGENQFAFGSQNIMISETGAVVKRRGYEQALTDVEDGTWTDFDEPLGIAEFYSPSGARGLIRIGRDSDDSSGLGTGTIRAEYNDADLPSTTTNWNTITTTIATTGTEDQFCDFASFRGRLYFATPAAGSGGGDSGLKYIQYSSGYSVQDVTLSGTKAITDDFDKPKGCELWFDRVWVYTDSSVNDGSYIYWTDTDGDDIPQDTNYLFIPGEGPITGLKRVYDRLLVFKKSSIYVLSGGADPENTLRGEPLRSDLGSIANRAVIEVDGLVYFVSERGIHATDGINDTYLSKVIEPDFSDMYRPNMSRAIAVHNRRESQIAFFLPFRGTSTGGAWGTSPWGAAPWGGGAIEQKCFVYDYYHKSWCAPYSNQPFTVATAYTNEVSVSQEDDEIVVVGSNENYNELFIWDSSNSDNGTTVEGKLVTRQFDMGDDVLTKCIRKLHLKMGGVGNDDGYVPVRIEIHDDYGDLAGSAKSTTNITLEDGSYERVNWQDSRHTVGATSNDFKISIFDYNDDTADGGPWACAGITVEYSTRGSKG